MDAAPLILGINACGRYFLDDSNDTRLPERIDSAAKAAVLIAWPSSAEKNGSLSVAMGCEDGQSLIFSDCDPSTFSSLVYPSQSSQSAGSREKSPISPSSSPKFLRPPSPTPSRVSKASSYLRIHGQAPSMVAPRSSPTLALPAKAQVEAPKSHVNYDEEPDHLRAILKTNRTDALSRSVAITTSSGSTTPSSPIDDPFSKESRSPRLTSTEEIVPTTSATITEPAKRDGPKLCLRIKICPPRIGFGHSVAALKLLDGNSVLACLQQCG